MGKKALSVARYMLEQRQRAGEAITAMQLIKLVYIAHGYMLGRHGRPLFDDEDVEAWQHGPVVPSVYHAVKASRSAPVQEVHGADALTFPEAEVAVMQTVMDLYGPYDGIALSAATHRTGTPWSITWGWFGRNAPISNELIANFYANLLSRPTYSGL